MDEFPIARVASLTQDAAEVLLPCVQTASPLIRGLLLSTNDTLQAAADTPHSSMGS